MERKLNESNTHKRFCAMRISVRRVVSAVCSSVIGPATREGGGGGGANAIYCSREGIVTCGYRGSRG